MTHKSFIIIIAAAILNTAAAHDTLFHIFSVTAARSVTSQSFAGAGTAMLQDGFGGLHNPALAGAAIAYGLGGAMAAGYWKDPSFDRLALPLGAVFADKGGGAMGVFYRFLNGGRGRVHDAVINLSGRMFEQVDTQGPVDFGLNLRYEHSVWRREYEVPADGPDNGENGESEIVTEARSGNFRARNILMDIGFYQTNVLPGLDFSFVMNNVTGYRWTDIDGGERDREWVGGRYRTMTVGILYTIPVFGGFALRIPFDLEMANVFEKSVENKYVARAGLEARIIDMYAVRFGYAHAPEDPMDLVKDFNYENLFFGGVGVTVKPVQLDLFIGKDVFGATATYYY